MKHASQVLAGIVWLLSQLAPAFGGEVPLLESELIFPPEDWHNHASCVVETPRGDLMACWFHGSGERKADDVRIEGARLRRGARVWSPRFTMADTPGYPDTNPAMCIDPRGRLWLFYPTILANLWESALMKYRISSDYQHDGAPRWSVSEVMHITPGTNFVEATLAYAKPYAEWVQEHIGSWPEEDQKEARRFLNYLKDTPRNKLQNRLGWMTRAHPVVLDGTRLLVPLYSDGYSFSLMAYSDDWGGSWQVSTPLCGAGNIQPSVVRRRDGSLYVLMRDNGPPPKRLMASSSPDRGETWTPVIDTDIPNPGSGADVIGLRNGHWALIGNDTEHSRHSLAVWISDDEGRTWRWKRHLELDPGPGRESSFHYPSLMQSRDGTLHATYSHHPAMKQPPGRASSIKHAHFNEAWVLAGDR